MNQINDNCVKLVKKFEGFRGKPYLCPAGKPTIGYGATYYNDGRRVTLEDKAITEEEAEDMLMKMLSVFSEKVVKVCDNLGLKFDDNKFSALVSFAYNCGVGALTNVLTKYKDGLNIETLINQYKFATIDGVKTELRGLMFRRKAEVKLFKNGIV